MADDELIRDHRQILSRQMAEIDRLRAERDAMQEAFERIISADDSCWSAKQKSENAVSIARAVTVPLEMCARVLDRALKAEAERDAMREAIRKIRATDNITAVWHIADGALAPSPKG